MEEVLDLISKYGLDTIVLALIINFLTAIAKKPVKYIANKKKNKSKITRVIVFFPIIIGFIVVFVYKQVINGEFVFNKEFARLWLSASSLSLTFYAVFEKFFFSKNETVEQEISGSKEIIDKVQEGVEKILDSDSLAVKSIREDENNEEKTSAETSNKIILKGKTNA